MRKKRSWAITHSLTPQPTGKRVLEWDEEIPELPLPKKAENPYNHSNILRQRSRKHRLIDEKNTEIERNNRILIEKLKKIKERSPVKEKPK